MFSGDGANDVNMIQAADIGIGISGQEGMQVGIDFFTSMYVLCSPASQPQMHQNSSLSSAGRHGQ